MLLLLVPAGVCPALVSSLMSWRLCFYALRLTAQLQTNCKCGKSERGRAEEGEKKGIRDHDLQADGTRYVALGEHQLRMLLQVASGSQTLPTRIRITLRLACYSGPAGRGNDNVAVST